MRKIADFVKRHLAVALVAIACSAPFAIAQGMIFVAQNGTATVPSIYGIGDTTSGLSFGTGYTSVAKHLVTVSTAPTASGTNCTAVGMTAGSTDTAGTFTNGTATTGCIITFGTAYTTAPFCNVIDRTTPADSAGVVITAAHIALGTIVSGDVITYACFGQAGG